MALLPNEVRERDLDRILKSFGDFGKRITNAQAGKIRKMSSMPLICATCGQANREAARFCAGCGDALPLRCSSCGTLVSGSARYCDACGASVASSEVSAGRKVVSVVFADLAGSTALQEALDAESVRSVMARFYEAMRSVVEAHGGRVEKFIGDAVVAVFGAPSVREDDALRAVRAAAAMSSTLTELNGELERDWGVRLVMRTAVNTGELVIGGGEIVVGDTMNTAARLEQAAGAGEVLVGETTWQLVRHALELEPIPPLDLKGKADAVRAWRLVSAARRTDGAQAPLVGREAELARLRAALDGTIEARACRLVTVIGSPGVGKTRLAREFVRGLGEQAIVVEGHCELAGEGIALLPVAEIVRTLANIGEADPPGMVRTKLATLVSEDPDRERLVERVAGVLGVAEPVSAEETFWALRRGLESLASKTPMVIVLDDLHWGQPMFLDLVEHLIEWVRDAAVLLLALARGELRETREALTSAGRRAVDVIELAPLDEDHSRALVNLLLGGVELPPALGDRILHTSEGNPLFLGEMLRILLDEGALRREEDEEEVWLATADIGGIALPPTVHALLAARIERLGSDERSVVERAAVIGNEFYRGAVAALVAPRVSSRIDAHLETLRRKDMVEPEGTYWIDEPVYRFHHGLIRDAAYRSLLKEARAALHERFADWLERKAGELVGEHEGVIAFHLEQAHEYRRQLGPLDDRGHALGARAAERLHSAGRRALAREDLAAAGNLLDRALERDAGQEAEILWDLCETVLSAGDTTAAAGLVERYAAGAGDDPRRRGRTAVLEGQLANLTGAGHVAGTIASVTTAAGELSALGDQAGEAKGWHVTAQAHARLGQIGAVEEALDRALAAARAADDHRRITAVFAAMPQAALWGPSPMMTASGRCLEVVRLVRMRPGNRHVEAIALRCQAVLEAMRDRTRAARELLADVRADLEELGLSLELHETAIHAGLVELLADEAAGAERLLRDALKGFTALGVSPGAAQAAALLARALLEQGHDHKALEQTRFAEEHGGEDLKTTITWCGARAEALARQGHPEQALTLARHAVGLAEPTDALVDKAEASMALARVLNTAGRDDEARGVATRARELYAAKGHAPGVQRAVRLAGAPLEVARTTETSASDGVPARPAQPSTRGPERLFTEYVRRFNAHDLDGLLELYAEECVLVDHRRLGHEMTRGREEVERALRSIFEGAPDVRLEIDEVLASDERVIAMRWSYRGHTADGGGEIVISAGRVAMVEHARWVSDDMYEYDDDEAMLACYAELGGGQGPLPDHPA